MSCNQSVYVLEEVLLHPAMFGGFSRNLTHVQFRDKDALVSHARPCGTKLWRILLPQDPIHTLDAGPPAALAVEPPWTNLKHDYCSAASYQVEHRPSVPSQQARCRRDPDLAIISQWTSTFHAFIFALTALLSGHSSVRTRSFRLLSELALSRSRRQHQDLLVYTQFAYIHNIIH